MDDRIDTAPCGFVSFSDDGIIHEVNDELLRQLKMDREAVEGRHLERILSSGGKVFYHTHFLPLLKLQQRAYEIYFSLRASDGEEVPVLINGARNVRNGRTLNDCIIVRMHLRNRYEQELLLAKKAAEAASAAKAKFLSMMSHDLRTPLQTVSGYTSLLLQGLHGPLGPDQKESLEQIKNATQELTRLLDDVLTFAQMESGRVSVRNRPHPVTAALDRVESLVRLRMSDAGLSYEREPFDESLIVNVDPDRLQQILLNLLTNAIKFTPRGGRIATSVVRVDGQVQIEISDNGPGIAPEHQEMIFEPFKQVAPTDSEFGVGLGLAISRDLARAMGGDLTVESSPGQGAKFRVRLEAAERPQD